MDDGLVWARSTWRAPKPRTSSAASQRPGLDPARSPPGRRTRTSGRTALDGPRRRPANPIKRTGSGLTRRRCASALQRASTDRERRRSHPPRGGLGSRRRDLLTPGMFDRRTSGGPPKDEGLAPNTTGSDPLGHPAAASAASQIEEANRYGGGKRA